MDLMLVFRSTLTTTQMTSLTMNSAGPRARAERIVVLNTLEAAHLPGPGTACRYIPLEAPQFWTAISEGSGCRP